MPINAAKTELREGYKTAGVERILSVHADMSDGQASFLALTQSSCFSRISGGVGAHHHRHHDC